jgi:hypothetical protein
VKNLNLEMEVGHLVSPLKEGSVKRNQLLCLRPAVSRVTVGGEQERDMVMLLWIADGERDDHFGIERGDLPGFEVGGNGEDQAVIAGF